MKIGRFELTLSRAKAYGDASLSTIYSAMGYMMGLVREAYAGAWQHNVVKLETQKNILAFSAVYACIAMIAGDISKLRMRLMQLQASGVWIEVPASSGSPFLGVLRKPNPFQTYIQFLSEWVVSLLVYGNTYVYKQRDARGVVTELYVLNPALVTPLLNTDGQVFYRLRSDGLKGAVAEDGSNELIVPAREIVHDRCVTLWHPLVGVPPLYAAASTATMGIRMQAGSAQFFENMSRPSGHLTTDKPLDDKQFAKVKERVEGATSDGNLGRLLITGSGFKFEPMNFIPADQAQLVEQLRWTAEDVARAFGAPPYKIAAQTQAPSYNNIGSLNQDYYSQCLQSKIESIEVLMDEALGLGPTAKSPEARVLGVELDVGALLRMDPVARMEWYAKGVTSGILKPDEARADDGRQPVDGGDQCFMQQQMVPIAQLAKRDITQPATPPAAADPNAGKPPALPAPADPSTGDSGKAAAEVVDLARARATLAFVANFAKAFDEEAA